MAFWNFLPLLFGGGGAAAAAGTAAAGAAATASLAPSLIGAGASLLGGALSARAEKKGIAAQNAYNHPTAIRQRAEEAGFNPLLFIGPGVGQQTAVGGSNYMGSAIANAGMQIADQMSKNQELARLEKLSAENKKLAEKVQTLTIRPKVGGVYAQRAATPSLAASLGGQNAEARSRGGAPARLLQDGSFGVDPTDAVKPQATHTYETYGNDGAVTNVPIGPDLDEIISGAVIAAHNKAKAKKAFRDRNAGTMTFGTPLAVPWGLSDRFYELMPPVPSARFVPSDMTKHPPKGAGYRKNIYDTRPLFTQWGVY